DCECRLGGDFAAEIELTAIYHDLLNCNPVHNAKQSLCLGAGLQQRMENLSDTFETLRQNDVGRVKFTSVRINRAHAAGFRSLHQYFFFEFDGVRAGQQGSDVDRCRHLMVGMAELKREFVIGLRQAFLIEHPPAKDKTMIVEAELRCVEEKHLTQMSFHRLANFADFDADLLGGMPGYLPEFMEMCRLDEMFAAQQKLVLAVGDGIRHHHGYAGL